MNISIFGLGYVGAVSLACFARDGHSVIGVDIDKAKLEMIRSGKAPVVEGAWPRLWTRVRGLRPQWRLEAIYTLMNLLALRRIRGLG